MVGVLRMFMRVLGLTWIGVVGYLAWQYAPHLSALAAAGSKPAAPASAAMPARSEAASSMPRVVYQGSVAGPASNERPGPVPTPPVQPARQATPEVTAMTASVQAAPLAHPPAAAPVPTTPRAAAPGEAMSAERATPAARVNLNTASVAELNGLGGGMIGRAIIAGRPYRDPEDLLSKRVLNRAAFARIREQVAAR